MRLLNVRTLEFRDFWVEPPPYAIASHRWNFAETTYKRFRACEDAQSPGRRKVEDFCRLVSTMNQRVIESPAWTALGFRLNCDWLWIDTACIDKTDSVELSEAINSMFRWYRGAAVCYAYLEDVRSIRDYQGAMLDFMQSEWFSRGWTLQELLAPGIVVFVTKDWEVLGHKCGYDKPLCNVVCRGFGQRLDFVLSRITRIPLDVIRTYSNAKDKDIKEKIAWLNRRITTRPEDRAYCLLGICDIFMAPIYGEGEAAWRRLQRLIREKENQGQDMIPYPIYQGAPRGHDAEDYAAHRSDAAPARISTLGEARVRKEVLWAETKQALDNVLRTRTDNAMAKRRLANPASPLRVKPNNSSFPSTPRSPGPEQIEPKELGRWLPQSRLGKTVSPTHLEFCAYCHGIIYTGSPTTRCESTGCTSLFHSRCAGQKCQKCSAAQSPPPQKELILPESTPSATIALTVMPLHLRVNTHRAKTSDQHERPMLRVFTESLTPVGIPEKSTSIEGLMSEIVSTMDAWHVT